MTTSMTLSTDQIAEARELLRDEQPPVILKWAIDIFGDHLTMATAFGVEGCCLLHWISELKPDLYLFNLDTGYQFQETLELRERIQERYKIQIHLVQPELNVEQYEREHGGPLYLIRSDQCCHDRKIVPLRKALQGKSAWISSIRRDQTADRAKADVVQWDAKFGLVKVNPLLNWTRKDVWAFQHKNDVPYNPLLDAGYTSIGCWPCTRPVGEGEDERAGRWAGTVKKECGLHVLEHEDGSGI